MNGPRTVLVVGNPRAGSRTRAAGERLVEALTGAAPALVVDLADHAAALAVHDHPEADAVAELVAQTGGADLVVVASPTYKATYTGLLKLFLERFARHDGMRGAVVPLMLGATPEHALAVEVHLRPVLAELGAAMPTAGLFVLEHEHDDPAAYAAWLDRHGPRITSLLAHPQPAPPLARPQGVPA